MKVFRSIVPLLLLTGVLAGCSKNPTSVVPGSTGNEQAKIAAALATQPALLNDGISDSGDITPVSLTPAGGASSASAIQPLRFWRVITSRERTFEFAFADTDTSGKPTSAIVTVHTTLKGRFNILIGIPGSDSTPMDSTLRIIHKPLEEERVRRVLLQRVTRKDGWRHHEGDGDEPGEEDDHESAWKIVGTSLAVVTDKDATTQIVSVRLQTATLDTTITDPMAFFRLRRIPCMIPRDSVTVTVTTLRNDDVVVFMAHGGRHRFHNNGDNTYTAVWGTGIFTRGLNQVGVQALSNGTLFDDEAPVDTQQWILPHTFFPESLAEFLP